MRNGVAKERPPPAGGNALVTFDAQLAKQQEEAQLAKERPKPRNDYLDCYTGPKVKWEDTGLYKALVKSQDIEEELTKIRNLIRKRTDPGYDPEDEDFKVAPIRKFDVKADYYKLLEVDDFASVKDIKGAYKKLALQYHPDKNRDKKPEKLREMQDEFEKIQEAYEILSDRATRRQYDRQRFDEARAKSQGMNSSFYSQKTNTDSNFWGRWSGETSTVKTTAKKTSLPKAKDLRLEVKISLEKALRGGLKIKEVKRDRMQRAFGSTSQNLKTVNVKIDPGQADGSEFRLPGDGHWPSFNVSPGDLVVVFRHKVHQFLRQGEGGALQLAQALQVRAQAMQPVVAAWSPTFKGSMVLLRFRNPLLQLAPSKACSVHFVLEGEGLPLPHAPTKRGPLHVTVKVHLDGNALVPTINCCRDVLLKRHVKRYNHQASLRVSFSKPSRPTALRKHVAFDARDRSTKVSLPSVAVVWESDMDLVSFSEIAAALGFHAIRDAQAFAWSAHAPLLARALRYDDAPLSEAELQEHGHGLGAAMQLTEVQEFLLRFDLGPPEGFSAPREPMVSHEVKLEFQEPEGDEEKELTRLIREKQSDLEQVKRSWAQRRAHASEQRREEEGELRELLEKDKKRELERVEREMNGLRSNFEFQLQAEKKWVDEFMQQHNYQNQWICVFKPAMVVRNKPAEDGPITRRLLFDEVVKAKNWKVTEDHWIQLETEEWALTWHQAHGQLLQRYFNAEQPRFNDLQAKIEERRKTRNETFVAYRRKKKEVEAWSIPPGPSEEEKCEMEDEEGEQLHFLMEPIVKELKAHKRRLRELRQKRLEAASERQRQNEEVLPPGFEAMAAEPVPETPPSPPPAPMTKETKPWEETKHGADKAFKDKDWNLALSLYSKALDFDMESLQRATILSNRALCYSRVFEWQKCLEDATAATGLEMEWPKGWLRRATAELRLSKLQEALDSLKRGLGCAGKTAGQFLALATECEAGLYNDRLEELGVPSSASGRIAKFKEDGDQAFKQTSYGVAILWYTRALYHRSMMEGRDEAVVLSNRAACFLKLELAKEALADALSASEKDPLWSKPLVRAGQAALKLEDFKAAYQHFAKARRLDEHYEAANDGVNACLQMIIRWEYAAAVQRWSRFAVDRQRPREELRIWALSDVYFDQHGVPEWCKSLSSSFFRNDVLMLAGNVADSLPQLRFGLTVLKSKFRRIFFVPGNHDLWVRRVTLSSLIRGEQVKDERDMGDSISKFLEVLQVCDELGVETAPAEVAAGVFVLPMFSWYSRDFISKAQRQQHASASDADAKVTIDQWITWPFPCGADDAWKFFMRMNEAAMRATLVAKTNFERFCDQPAQVLSMSHFLTRPELSFDWTVPGLWDHIGCEGLDEQVRSMGSACHVYGRACMGHQVQKVDGLSYVHNYIGSTDQHRPGMAPYCIFDGTVLPSEQPCQSNGFNFQPLKRPEEPPRRFGGG